MCDYSVGWLACDAEGVFPVADSLVDVFIIDVTGGDEASVLADQLRAAGISSDRAYDKRSMKAQFRAADKSGAALALIVGEDELAADQVTVRTLQGDDREQISASRSTLIDELNKRLT